MISVRFQGKPFSITVIQVYAPSSNAEEAEIEWFYEDLQGLLELTLQKDALFIIGDWNKCKSRKTDSKSNRQIWPWGTKWSRAKANKSFAKRMHWSKQTPSSNNTRDDSTHAHHQMVNTEIRFIIFFAAKDKALYREQKQDLELTVAPIINSL